MGAETEDLVVISPEVTAQIQLLQAEVREKGYHFTVGYNPALKYSLEELCGLVEPPDWRQRAPLRSMLQAPLASQPLPSAFDWRALNGVTPVRNQRSCGSCWAFGTVAVLESALKIRSGVAEDLSEQYLISCNESGWDCEGGWWAHDYHEWRVPEGESAAGAVLESDFPYTWSDELCNPPHSHPYVIDSWAYVDPYVAVPTVGQIKHAIYTCGPVGAAVYVGSWFQAYTGGVFEHDETPSSPPYVNHAVVLVGWNDDYYGDGSNVGVWILRNSWGTGWGVGGYMYIAYGTSLVGYAANYVELPRMTALHNVDFDGDGNMDILWRNQSGTNAIWYNTSAGTVIKAVGGIPSCSTSWEAAGVADFDGDSLPDILWRNATTGNNTIWYLQSNGTSIKSVDGMPSCSTVWQVGGVADFDADGVPDILWRNPTTGGNTIWYMQSNGTSIKSVDGMPSCSTVWHVGKVTDFDADGVPDILWRNSFGHNALWYMNSGGNSIKAAGGVPSCGTSWEIGG